jgi:hypothetical protein
VPPLPNARTELFSQGIAAGKSATQAYSDAGYKPSRSNAAMLLRKQNISDRVAEIIREKAEIHRQGVAQAIQATQVTVETILASLTRALEGAESEKDWRTAVAAAMAQARVTGNIAPERHLVKNVGPSPSELSDEELAERVGMLQARIRAEQEEFCERLGVSPNEITLAILWELEDSERGVARADEALDVTPEDEPRGTRHMPPGVIPKGIRAPEYVRPKPQMTRGEADRLARKPGPKVISGVAVPASGVNGRR